MIACQDLKHCFSGSFLGNMAMTRYDKMTRLWQVGNKALTPSLSLLFHAHSPFALGIVLGIPALTCISLAHSRTDTHCFSSHLIALMLCLCSLVTLCYTAVPCLHSLSALVVLADQRVIQGKQIWPGNLMQIWCLAGPHLGFGKENNCLTSSRWHLTFRFASIK